MDPGPVLLEETRNDRIQAVHNGHGVVLDPDGQVIASWGDPETATYLRSSPKPLQAIPFIEGPMTRLGLGSRALALACASHSAEAAHVRLAREMLEAAGLDESALQCHTHDRMTVHSGPRPQGGWTPLYNNCSGKHAAMLATCVHHGWDPGTYLQPDHPLQQHILALVRASTGIADVPVGIDGCGAPTFWVPISGLARMYPWLERHTAGKQALDAMRQHPWLVAGTGRFCTALGEATQGRIVGKIGAAGVYVALHESGASLAVKVADGLGKAAETLAINIAQQQGWLTPDEEEALAPFLRRPVTNCAGLVLGHMQARL